MKYIQLKEGFQATINRKTFFVKSLFDFGQQLAKKTTFKNIKSIFTIYPWTWNYSRVLDSVLGGIFNQLGEDKYPTKKGYYPSIRFSLKQFINNKFIAGNALVGNTFLDIGSCNGEKLAAAVLLGYGKVIGVEVSKKSCDIASKFFKGESSINIYNIDAFQSGKIIKKADIIYTFCPIQNKFLMRKLWLHILKNMKVGAQHIEMLPSYQEGLFKRVISLGDILSANESNKRATTDYNIIKKISNNWLKIENKNYSIYSLERKIKRWENRVVRQNFRILGVKPNFVNVGHLSRLD